MVIVPALPMAVSGMETEDALGMESKVTVVLPLMES